MRHIMGKMRRFRRGLAHFSRLGLQNVGSGGEVQSWRRLLQHELQKAPFQGYLLSKMRRWRAVGVSIWGNFDVV